VRRFTLTDEPLALAESQFLQGFQRIPVVRRSALNNQ
jgi:hypothetical protein